MTRSFLDDLGAEVTGIVSPVSICMALTVVLVRVLNPEGTSDPTAVAIANIYYHEQDSDSAGTKIEGAVVNSIIFVVFVGLMTFVLVLLFKYGYVNIIWGYMGFAGFSIFFVLGGVIALQLIQLTQLPIDIFSFCYILYNFSVVGVLTLFFIPAPLLLKQGYLIITSIVTAFIFTNVPAWTTWTLLIAMALYDLWAVLTPGGPLKMLLDVAMERDEDIPALIYEARAVRRPNRRDAWASRGSNSGDELMPITADPPPSSPTLPGHVAVPLPLPLPIPVPLPASSAPLGGPSEMTHQQENRACSEDAEPDKGMAEGSTQLAGRDQSPGAGAMPNAPGAASDGDESAVGQGGSAVASRQPTVSADEDEGSADEGAPLMAQPHRSHDSPSNPTPVQGQGRLPRSTEEDDDGPGLPDAIKLGLGDFIFYSVLVGRAAMYDLLTAFAAYLAIIAGLGATLLLLAVKRHALPALPFSIALGVVFYFLARWALEPFVLPLSTHLLLF